MTGPQFAEVRKRLGLTLEAFGRALGFSGSGLAGRISDMEAGRRTITPTVGRLAEQFGLHGVPEEYLRE